MPIIIADQLVEVLTDSSRYMLLARILDTRHLLMVHLVPISVRCHNILVRILTGLRIRLSDECSVGAMARLSFKAGAASKSQQTDS
jgi:hypothetical protein